MKFYAIIGTGRSGTTLSTNLVDGINENIYVHPIEINFITAFHDLSHYGKITNKTKYYANFKSDLKLNRVKKKFLIQYYSGQILQLKNNFINQISSIKNEIGDLNLENEMSQDDYSLDEFVNEFFKIITCWIFPTQKKNIVIFKTIDVAHCDKLKKNISNLKLIHIIRDPIKTYESLVRSPRMDNSLCFPSWYLAGDNLTTMIRRWIHHSRYVIDHISDTDNNFILKYEDLVKDTSIILNNLKEYIKLNNANISNQSTILGGYKPKELVHNMGIPADKNYLELRVENLRHQSIPCLNDQEKETIIFSTYSLSKKLGYFQNEVKPNIYQILILWLRIGSWEVKNISDFYKYRYNEKQLNIFNKIFFIGIGIFSALRGIIIRRVNIFFL